MKKGTKIKNKLSDRVKRWEVMPSSGASGNSKFINGYAFHKPGSQNLRKGN